MEQNTPKFRIRLNLFDTLVLIAVLVAGAAMVWFGMRGQQGEGANTSASTVRYTIRFQQVAEGNSELIEPGDPLTDTVKNFKMGHVVSVESKPAMVQVLDHEERVYRDTVLEGYEDVYVTVESACTDSQEALLLDGGYDFRVGQLTYVRGPGYMGSGPVVSIERGNHQ